MTKKITAMILAVIMLVGCISIFASCGGDAAVTTAKPSTTTAPQGNGDTPTTADRVLYDLPTANLGGATVRFIIGDADGDGFNTRSIIADASTGDEVDAAIDERNELIKEKLNCDIQMYEEVPYTDNIGISSRYGTQLLAGEKEIDIIAGRQWSDVSLCLKGYLQDLNALKGTEADYLNWDKEYWDGEYAKGMNYGDKIYWITGDLNLRYTGGFYTVFMNEALYNKSCKSVFEDGEKINSVYDLVYEGKWTWDNALRMAELAFQDIGTTPDAVDEGDTLGMIVPAWDNCNAMVIGSGITFSTENADGTIVHNLTRTNRRLMDFDKKMAEVLTAKGVLVYPGSPDAGNPSYREALQQLSSDKALMVFGRLNQAELYLRDMETNYFILPYPKLDEKQETYHSPVHDAISLYGIHNSSVQKKEAAAVLEALAIGSYNTVKPVYYEQALKFKYSRDNASAKMIDFISDHSYSDFLYVWGHTSDLSEVCGSFFRGNNFGKRVPSDYASKSTKWQESLNGIVADLKALGN